MKHFFFMRVKGAEARAWSAKCEMVALTEYSSDLSEGKASQIEVKAGK